ncbi:hypothetical protein RhiirB3_389551 [Rhizophagus irregularis]|nr:hypothetical protein RhiirB3_389551 [Rhizophagus irregularis]
MPFLSILTKYIVKTEEKVNKSNLKTFCKVCIEVLGKEEGLSYGWALSWINNPKAKELFEFLNPFLKLPDCCVLSGDILDKVVVKLDDAMDIALKEDPVAMNISSECENYIGVINKTEKMLEDLKKKEITVCAIVIDSASAYAAARQFNNDVWYYWCFASVSTNELGFIACRVFGICVNTAFVERLWSCMGFLQSKYRNRLMLTKALSMSKLRADITYSHRLHNNSLLITKPTIDDITNIDQDPDNLDNSADNLVPTEENNSEESDDEANESDEPKNEFSEYLQGWVEILEKEKKAESNGDSNKDNDSIDR